MWEVSLRTKLFSAFLILATLSAPALAQNAAAPSPEHVTACVHYKAVAAQIIVVKNSGASYEYAANWAADKAYGPHGEAYRNSEDNAHAYMMLAAAVYFARDKYGTGDAVFVQQAYDRCLRGELLDASPKH